MMGIQLLSNHQEILDKFVIACQADERIIAALLFGSYVKGRNDEHSDLDLGLITTNEAFDDFVATRESFIRQIDTPCSWKTSKSRM